MATSEGSNNGEVGFVRCGATSEVRVSMGEAGAPGGLNDAMVSSPITGEFLIS
jgi:hypothetical protein